MLDSRFVRSSKTKVGLFFVGALLFAALGVALASLDSQHLSGMRRHPPVQLIQAIGAVAAIFFSIVGLGCLYLFFDRRHGIVLDSAGFTDYSSLSAVGFVAWAEVEGFEVEELLNQKLLVVKVRNPAKFVSRGTALARALRHSTNKMSGSPVVISSSGLKASFEELTRLFAQYKSAANMPNHSVKGTGLRPAPYVER
jgi:hypothetical protein